LANNHAFDYTREALEDTMNRLKTADINYTGAGFTEKEAYSSLIKRIKNTKIAFLSYTNLGPASWKAKNSSGIAHIGWEDLEKVKKDIAKPKKTQTF